MELVDMVRKTWNTLEGLVRDWSESLSQHLAAKNLLRAA